MAARTEDRAAARGAASVRTAVFPVAGLGTRFLPATKAVPKELLPVVDRPVLQYAVAEALEAGVERLVFVTSPRKPSIAAHFDPDPALEASLEAGGKRALLDTVRGILPPGVSCHYVQQPEPLGLGHAVLCAEPEVRGDPFAVILPDDLVRSDGPGCLAQMLAAHRTTGAAVLSVQPVSDEDCRRYGIVAPGADMGGHPRITGLVEKPAPEDAPSRLGVVGRYLLPRRVFEALRGLAPGAGGEIQLTDGIAVLLDEMPVVAFRFEGTRYDCGSHLGFIRATVDEALSRPELATELREHLRRSLAGEVS